MPDPPGVCFITLITVTVSIQLLQPPWFVQVLVVVFKSATVDITNILAEAHLTGDDVIVCSTLLHTTGVLCNDFKMLKDSKMFQKLF